MRGLSRQRIVLPWQKFKRLDKQGVAPVEIVEGLIGSDVRVRGTANLPVLARFSPQRDLLFGAEGQGQRGLKEKTIRRSLC
jgi:hypothetical protein